MKFEIFKPQTISRQGKVSIQADCVFPVAGEATIHDRLFVVADGQGVANEGKMAANTVCSALADYFFQTTCSDEPFSDEMFAGAVSAVGNAVSEQCPAGATASLAMLYFHRHGCLAAHVGHCRIYHVRPKTRELLYRSQGTEGAVVAAKGFTEALVGAHITNVQYGDRFLLLSQGAADALSDQRVTDILSQRCGDDKVIQQIGEALEACGDNHTACLIRVSGVMHEALDEHLRDNERQLMQKAAASAMATAQPRQPASAAHKQKSSTPHVAAQPLSQPESQYAPQHEAATDDEKGRGGVPIFVWAALATLAILAGTLYYFGHQKKQPEPEPVVEEVKKDTVKKDTVNVMELERNKVKKDTTKVAAPERSAYRPPEPDSIYTNDTVPGVKTGSGYLQPESDGPSVPRHDTPPANPAPAGNTTAPATSAPAATTPSNPNQVTPRPVIPEDE